MGNGKKFSPSSISTNIINNNSVYNESYSTLNYGEFDEDYMDSGYCGNSMFDVDEEYESVNTDIDKKIEKFVSRSIFSAIIVVLFIFIKLIII